MLSDSSDSMEDKSQIYDYNDTQSPPKYTTEFKKQVVLFAEEYNIKEATKQFGVADSTIRTWKKMRSVLFTKNKRLPNILSENGKRKRVVKTSSLKNDSLSESEKVQQFVDENDRIIEIPRLLKPDLVKVDMSIPPPPLTPILPVISSVPDPKNLPEVNDNESEEVCIRWNSHHSNMKTSFPSLLQREKYVDVTLTTEGKSLKCHKLILSSCSSYFDELLKDIMPCQHPVFFLNDIPFWLLKCLIEFMYAGEVYIEQRNLQALLKVAELLKVKGLTGKSNQPEEKQQQQVKQEKPASLAKIEPAFRSNASQESETSLTSDDKQKDADTKPPEVKFKPSEIKSKSQELRAKHSEVKYKLHENKSGLLQIVEKDKELTKLHEMKLKPQEIVLKQQEVKEKPQEINHKPHEIKQKSLEYRQKLQEIKQKPQENKTTKKKDVSPKINVLNPMTSSRYILTSFDPSQLLTPGLVVPEAEEPAKTKELQKGKKVSSKTLKRKKSVIYDPLPSTPLYKKGTKSRPTVKVPRYYHHDFKDLDRIRQMKKEQKKAMSLQSQDDSIDLDKIKEEPLEIEESEIQLMEISTEDEQIILELPKDVNTSEIILEEIRNVQDESILEDVDNFKGDNVPKNAEEIADRNCVGFNKATSVQAESMDDDILEFMESDGSVMLEDVTALEENDDIDNIEASANITNTPDVGSEENEIDVENYDFEPNKSKKFKLDDSLVKAMGSVDSVG